MGKYTVDVEWANKRIRENEEEIARLKERIRELENTKDEQKIDIEVDSP